MNSFHHICTVSPVLKYILNWFSLPLSTHYLNWKLLRFLAWIIATTSNFLSLVGSPFSVSSIQQPQGLLFQSLSHHVFLLLKVVQRLPVAFSIMSPNLGSTLHSSWKRFYFSFYHMCPLLWRCWAFYFCNESRYVTSLWWFICHCHFLKNSLSCLWYVTLSASYFPAQFKGHLQKDFSDLSPSSLTLEWFHCSSSMLQISR